MGTSSGSEKYSLKWNDFTSNLSVSFQELRQDQDFFDVKLLTDESEIRCHKLILGACSPKLRQIIKRMSEISNPAIYLRGVRDQDLKNIIEFMYVGEVSVGHHDLDSFLAVAQDLEIKGLTQDHSNDHVQAPVQDHHVEVPVQDHHVETHSPPAKKFKASKGSPTKNVQKVKMKNEPLDFEAVDHVDENVDQMEANVQDYNEPYYNETLGLDENSEDVKGMFLCNNFHFQPLNFPK